MGHLPTVMKVTQTSCPTSQAASDAGQPALIAQRCHIGVEDNPRHDQAMWGSPPRRIVPRRGHHHRQHCSVYRVAILVREVGTRPLSSGEAAASAAPADPHRYVGRFQGPLDDCGQVISDRVKVHRVFQPGRERGHGLVGVIPGPVEPPVHRPLHPPPHRVEQRRGGQRGGSHRHRGVEPTAPGWPAAPGPRTPRPAAR